MTGTTSLIRLTFRVSLETEATLSSELFSSFGSCFLPACSFSSSEFASLLEKRATAQRCATNEAHAHISLTILVEWVTTRVLSGVTVSILIAAGLDLVRRLHSSSTRLSRATSTTLFTPLHRPDHYAKLQRSSLTFSGNSTALPLPVE